MKISASVRMTLAHRVAKRDVWIIGTKVGVENGINTYQDLLARAMKQVSVEISNIETDLIALHDRILDVDYINKCEAKLLEENNSHYRESRLADTLVREEHLSRMTMEFNELRKLYVKIHREATEEDKQNLRDALPASECLDSFGFGLYHLRHEGHNLLAILAVIEEQWEYVKPCCNCGAKYGCDCGCVCEYYDEICDCSDECLF